MTIDDIRAFPLLTEDPLCAPASEVRPLPHGGQDDPPDPWLLLLQRTSQDFAPFLASAAPPHS